MVHGQLLRSASSCDSEGRRGAHLDVADEARLDELERTSLRAAKE